MTAICIVKYTDITDTVTVIPFFKEALNITKELIVFKCAIGYGIIKPVTVKYIIKWLFNRLFKRFILHPKSGFGGANIIISIGCISGGKFLASIDFFVKHFEFHLCSPSLKSYLSISQELFQPIMVFSAAEYCSKLLLSFSAEIQRAVCSLLTITV